ncbi:MAG TPA: extracellular solute-binding protein [Burkholderiales bacterium]|nr:extracellular solute-binding protein [Burkholderiales bacterium]
MKLSHVVGMAGAARAAAAALCWIVAAGAFAADDKVVVLTSYPQETLSLFESAFEKANPGIRAEIIWRMPRDAMPYLLEPGSHGVDVYWSASARNYAELAKRDLLAPLPSDPALPRDIGGFPIADPKLLYRSSEIAGYGFACNQARLAARQLACPKTWAALAQPEYTGRVLLPVPSKVGFAPLMYEILLQRLGWERGWALITEFAANSTLFVPGGAFITDRVAKGDEDVGVTIDFFAQSAIANGAALQFVYPDMIGFSPAHVAVLAGAPHPEAARKYVEFLLSDEGQRILARPDIRKLPVRPSTYASLEPGYFNPFEAAKKQKVDFDLQAAQRRQALTSALFDVLVTDRQMALRELWASVRGAERLAADKGDADAVAAARHARETLTWVPVSASQSESAELQRGFAEQSQTWAAQIEEHRAQAAKELETLLAKLSAERHAATDK